MGESYLRGNVGRTGPGEERLLTVVVLRQECSGRWTHREGSNCSFWAYLVSDSLGLGWGLRICIFEFPGDAAAATAGLGTTL